MIDIKRWDTGAVIYSGDFCSIKECLEDGVKKSICFDYADLNGAKLNKAKLNKAELNYAELNYAELNGDIDYSAWPLWCGSTKIKVSDRIARQLAYHAICVMNDKQKKEFLKDPINYANGFHRVDDCGEIKEAQDDD